MLTSCGMNILGMVIKMLEEHCKKIQMLFDDLEYTTGRLAKEQLVTNFKTQNEDLISDLYYCFEVLAGHHKIGYTYIANLGLPYNDELGLYSNCTIKQFVENLKRLSNTESDVILACVHTPVSCRVFMSLLLNRRYRLGYSNRENMITIYSPMLAKKYPDATREKVYFVQEKLDGNRCIAHFDFDEQRWIFTSRSGKTMKVDFNMDWANVNDIFDGEVMTLGHAGSRDFNRTSGAINGKYTDKSSLHYFIYDIIEPTMTYRERKEILDSYEQKGTGLNCQILPVLDEVPIYRNTSYNWKLDEWLDKITDKGGEGVILRDPDAFYACGKRSDGLLKYKKVQTIDLRIVGWNEGNGKYEGAIGSFICEDDDHTIRVSVSGMPDDIHYSDPEQWIGKIIEVAYFDESSSASNDYKSLRFPRLKRVRNDKDSTSTY